MANAAKIIIPLLILGALGGYLYLRYTNSNSDTPPDPQLTAAKHFKITHPGNPVIYYVDPNRGCDETFDCSKAVGAELFGANFDTGGNTVLIDGAPVATSSEVEDMPKVDCFYPDSCIADQTLYFAMPKAFVKNTFTITVRNARGTSNEYRYTRTNP